jgi:glycine/D-amino acid oxidase-like deaminating enzyme/nitrite reductase/ring-hydroxylating ferredoxin subunit
MPAFDHFDSDDLLDRQPAGSPEPERRGQTPGCRLNEESDSLIPELPHRSIWDTVADPARFPRATTDLCVDVAVIGAGITGITTAALASRAGLRVAVLEARRIGLGTTGHSTGNLYAPVDEYLHRLADKWGRDKVAAVVASRCAAIDLIEQHVAEYALDCDFSRQPWVLYATSDAPESCSRIESEFRAARDAGLDAALTAHPVLRGAAGKALVIPRQAQFDPLQYVRQLAAAIHSQRCLIFEDTPVRDIDVRGGLLRTARCAIRAEQIVMATHAPKGLNLIQTEMAAYREYAVAALLRERQLGRGIYWSAGPDKHSTRLVELRGRPYLLMIGERHKTGQKEDTEAAYRNLEVSVRARFAVHALGFRWSAQHYRAADGLPYIGPSPGASNLHLACGFATDGLTYGTLAGMILTDRILGRDNPFAALYSPRRFTPVKSAGHFLKENLNVVGYYIRDHVHSADGDTPTAVPRGTGRLVEAGGSKLAVYRDEADRLHVLSPVCTHMHCIVHWNSGERSWDCPCHGSRFHYDGSVIEGPALAPLQRLNWCGNAEPGLFRGK